MRTQTHINVRKPVKMFRFRRPSGHLPLLPDSHVNRRHSKCKKGPGGYLSVATRTYPVQIICKLSRSWVAARCVATPADCVVKKRRNRRRQLATPDAIGYNLYRFAASEVVSILNFDSRIQIFNSMGLV